jgi:signal transduction histidine kinase
MVRVLRDDASPTGADVEPPPGLAALDGLVKRHGAAGLQVTTTFHGQRRALPPGVDRAAYRILQEALTNAARHGDGGARVDLRFGPNALDVDVANSLNPDRAVRSAGGGQGIVGMRERASLLGGTLDAGARDGRFELHAHLPFADSGHG